MHRLGTMIQLALMKDDHALVQVEPGFDRFLHFGVAGPGVYTIQIGRPGIHVAAVCGAYRTLAVVDQRNIIDRFVCVIHDVECR